MNLLSFIDDREIEQYAREVIDKTQSAASEAEKRLYGNIVDPFSALFDSARQGIDMELWLEQEKARQVQKTLQNALGTFHQQVIGSIDGWHDTGIGGGYDVGNKERKVIAEVKNKHNTMNGRSAPSVYSNLAGHLQFSQKNYTAYLVQIVPKSRKPYNKEWSPNLKTMPLRSDIRRIDGRSFYELATGDPYALDKLYQALPTVLAWIVGDKAKIAVSSNYFEDLFKKAYRW